MSVLAPDFNIATILGISRMLGNLPSVHDLLITKVDEFHWCHIFSLLQARQICVHLPPLYSFFFTETCQNQVHTIFR